MNEVLKIIEQRRSIRKFEKAALSEEQIQALKEAALSSPTGMNRQELRYSFIANQNDIAAIQAEVVRTMGKTEQGRSSLERMKKREAENVFYGAPLVVLISGKETGLTSIDAGIAVQNLAIAAESMGLGSCIIAMIRSVFKPEHAEGLDGYFDFEDDETFRVAIAIGHKAMTKEAHNKDYNHIRNFT